MSDQLDECWSPVLTSSHLQAAGREFAEVQATRHTDADPHMDATIVGHAAHQRAHRLLAMHPDNDLPLCTICLERRRRESSMMAEMRGQLENHEWLHAAKNYLLTILTSRYETKPSIPTVTTNIGTPTLSFGVEV